DRLEEEERGVLPSLHPPDAGLDLARGHAHPHAYPGVLEEVRAVGGKVVDRLPVGKDALARIAVAPAEADADHRKREVARRLDQAAGQDTEPARVEWEVHVGPVF